MREAFAGLAVLAAFVGGVAAAPAADREIVTRFADPAITESSGLVVDGRLAVTVNDSGDSSRIFTVSLETGKTVGVTSWTRESLDNEALAPAGDGRVWVGDIGDNGRSRESVTVTRVPFGPGEETVAGEKFELVYPDGPADAEALLAHPSTGRLYVVTKDPLGGVVYAAPDDLRSTAPNELVAVGAAPPLVTGGEFLPSGDRIALRNYGRVVVLSFPALETLASADLPPQQQGEALAVLDDRSALLSSEGVRAPLLRVALPDVPASPVTTPSVSEPPPPEPSPSPGPNGLPQPTSPDQFEREPWQWLAGTAVLLVAIGVLIFSVRPR